MMASFNCPVDATPHEVWSQHARQWQRVGAPLRPTLEDGEIMLDMATAVLASRADAGQVVVLGVTPEVVQLAWPDKVRLLAMDQSAEMIAAVWQPHPLRPSVVRQSRWESMPLADASVDILVGDGSLNALPCTSDWRPVLTEFVRVLKPGGALIVRCFVKPDQPETLDEVAACALNGEIVSFHALKWRLAMALDGGEEFSVAVANIHAAFNRLFPDRRALARHANWADETIATIDAYQGVATRYTFPTLAAIQALTTPGFELMQARHGRYELAPRCPTLYFRSCHAT